MSWSAGFTAALGSDLYTPRFRLEIVQNATTSSPGGIATIEDSSITKVVEQKASLNPHTWQVGFGSMVIDFDERASSLLYLAPRGAYVEVYCRPVQTASYERIFIGQVAKVTGIRPGYQLTLVDVFAGLRTRAVTVPDELPLFKLAGNDGTLGSGGRTTTTAAWIYGDATMAVVDNTGFAFDGTLGAIKVEYSGGTEYVAIDAIGGGGVSFGTPTTRIFDGYPITASSIAAGATVTFLAYVEGNPFNVARRIFNSTGAGTNGTYDNLPVRWGFALLDSWWDHAETNLWRAQVQTDYGLDLEVFAEQQDDGISWLLDTLGQHAIFPVQAQGSLQLRCAQPIWASWTQPGPSSTTLTAKTHSLALDETLIELVTSHVIDSTKKSYAYGGIEIAGPSTIEPGSGQLVQSEDRSAVTTLPLQRYDYQQQQHAYDQGSLTQGLILEEYRSRMRRLVYAVGEDVSVLGALPMAQLYAGDVTTLTHRKLRGRLEVGPSAYTALGYYDERPVIVVGGWTDWTGGKAGIDLWAPEQGT